MKKFKSVLFVLSLIVNALFAAVIVTALFSKNSSLHYRSPPDGYVTAASVTSLPSGREAVFNEISLSLKPGDVCYLQYIFAVSKNQSSILINALYDPGIVSIKSEAGALEITALSEGETLMQTVTNDGIKNIALIRVEK